MTGWGGLASVRDVPCDTVAAIRRMTLESEAPSANLSFSLSLAGSSTFFM